MNDYTSNQTKSDEARILSIGSSLDLDFTLALTEKQWSDYGLIFNNITSLSQLKDMLLSPVTPDEDPNPNPNINNTINTSICNQIGISSPNILISSLLFINKANKVKSFIEYLVPLSAKYPDNLLFMRGVTKHVAEINFLFIDEHNLLDINPRITFTIKLLSSSDDQILSEQSFLISDTNIIEEGSNAYIGDLYSGFARDYQCTIFYSSIMDLFQCRLNSFDEIYSFLTHLIQDNPNMLLGINYSGYFDNTTKIEVGLINAIGEILKLTDIFIFEKKEIADFFLLMRTLNDTSESSSTQSGYGDQYGSNAIESHYQANQKNKFKPKQITTQAQTPNHRTNETINVDQVFILELQKGKPKQRIKIGVIIDELKTVTVIQQDPNSGLVLFHSIFELNFIPENITRNDLAEYEKIVFEKSNVIKGIFIGGFLSRLFNKKSFQTCFTAGNESIKRIIDIIRFRLDYPTDIAFYEILVKKPKRMNKEQLTLKKKEEHFILDCTNVLNSKKKEYNPLYDKMCQSYFNCHNNRSHLYKLGFINKNGTILQDPESKVFGLTKDTFLMSNYDKEKKNLLRLKENNEILKLQIKSVASGLSSSNVKNSSVDDLAYLSKINNYEKISNKKLPSIDAKTKSKMRSEKYKNDLYFREIKNSKFYNKKTGGIGGDEYKTIDPKAKSCYIDKEQFIGILDNVEKKAQFNSNDNSINQ